MSTRRRVSASTSTERLNHVIRIGFANSRCSIGAPLGDTEKLDEEAFKAQLKATLDVLNDVYAQALRIDAYVKNTGISYARLQWSDIEKLDKRDRDVLALDRWWAEKWLQDYTNASKISKDDVAGRRLVDLYWRLQWLIDRIPKGHRPIQLKPSRDAVALFSHDDAKKTLAQLR